MLAFWSFWRNLDWPQTYRGQQLAIPLTNFTAVALVIWVMEEKSWLGSICSKRWIRWLGRMSYSLYIIHYTYARGFWNVVIPRLDRHMPSIVAVSLSTLLAFCVTLMLAMLTYRFIEIPCQGLKRRLQYGEVKNSGHSASRQSVLVETAT